jgi:serine/threonine protein kinase
MSKLIDQGGFGCVFYPGFNCKSDFKKTDNKLVSKLQMNTFNARNEIYIGSLIQKISNYQLYYLPVISSCNITMASISQDIIDKCDIIEKGNDKYKILELPYLQNISFDTLFSDSTRSIRHLFLTFIETYKYVAIAIGNLIDNNIVHFDIKEQNILYSTKYENPILIDFGLSIPINKISNSNLKDYFYIYAPDYYLWPLEVHIINYILYEGKLTTDSIKRTASINYFSKFIKLDSATIIIQLLNFFKTWDLYSLSIMYLKFFNKLFKKGYFDNNFIILFSQLLLQNISPFPESRYSSIETQKKYTDIFFINEKPENYIVLIQQLEN